MGSVWDSNLPGIPHCPALAKPHQGRAGLGFHLSPRGDKGLSKQTEGLGGFNLLKETSNSILSPYCGSEITAGLKPFHNSQLVLRLTLLRHQRNKTLQVLHGQFWVQTWVSEATQLLHPLKLLSCKNHTSAAKSYHRKLQKDSRLMGKLVLKLT